MPRKKHVTGSKPSKAAERNGKESKKILDDRARARAVSALADMIRQERLRRLGPEATYEEARDAEAGLMAEALWETADRDLREAATDEDEVEVDDKQYRRLEQRSSATYQGRWGPHTIEEALYRQVGVHNGPTIKPIELRVGIVEHMTPDMARMVGELSAERSSRAVEKVLRVVGLVPPSRAFLADRVTQMGSEIADDVAELEEQTRATEPLSAEIASVSCGLDRMSVRMSEPASLTESSKSSARTEPYQRTPPPPKEHHYRKAWVASVSAYAACGKELHTWRYSTEAAADPAVLAKRVAADVVWIQRTHPEVAIHCIQDAAPELRALPEALALALPTNTALRELIDFEHLMGYLETVVDACEPEGDPNNWKGWYRSELLRDDGAIDRIWLKLRRLAKSLRGGDIHARDAVAEALSYIKKRKNKMRYASLYKANLPIGSGATESTCWQMQQRVKLPGQSWEPRGLRGTLAIRALVLSNRWNTAWNHHAKKHRKEVRVLA